MATTAATMTERTMTITRPTIVTAMKTNTTKHAQDEHNDDGYNKRQTTTTANRTTTR